MRGQKFITLTLNRKDTQLPCEDRQPLFLTAKRKQIVDFESDKETFLQQIRSFSASGGGGSAGKTGGTEASSVGAGEGPGDGVGLSGLLDSLSGEVFSDMFLSSSVRGRIQL